MNTVTRFEADLLRILHGILQRSPLEQILPLIYQRRSRPAGLSPTATALVEDALGKGCVTLLAREDGWCKERFLRNEQPVLGRLWERTEPVDLGLSFSVQTLELLMWLTANDPRRPTTELAISDGSLRSGDRLFFFLAYEALRHTDFGHELRTRPGFAGHELCWLAFPGDFAEESTSLDPRFDFWTTSAAFVIEALQTKLANCWLELEFSKARIAKTEQMLALGDVQQRVLSAFFRSADKAGRRDLVRFVLRAADWLLADRTEAHDWVAGLNLRPLRLADREACYRAALTLLHQLKQLTAWQAEAESIGRFDEGYEASQLWKSDWESYHGERLCRRADQITQAVAF